MKDFFIFETEVPNGGGFELFGKGHLLWIFCITIFAVIFSLRYSKETEAWQKKAARIMGCYMVVSGLVRDVILAVRGHFSVAFWPLHLCAMALLIAAIYSFTGNRYLGMVYLLLCIPGAFSALLFPDWVRYPFFSYMNIHAFISHGLLVTFGLMHYVSGRLVPRWRDIWMPLSFALAGSLIVYPFNRAFGTNFWFLNRPSVGSPLIFIAELAGDKWYLPAYFIFCTIIIFIWQGILICAHYVNHKVSHKNEDKNSKKE